MGETTMENNPYQRIQMMVGDYLFDSDNATLLADGGAMPHECLFITNDGRYILCSEGPVPGMPGMAFSISKHQASWEWNRLQNKRQPFR
jgi:hypothetical protein